MNIKVNGEVKEYPNNLTLDKLIDDLGIKDKVMASAVNMEIVKKDNWSSCILKDGDIIELLDFVGGG